jgi:arylsulfatase
MRISRVLATWSIRGPFRATQAISIANCVTIAEVLRAGGYQTMASGKWHVTPVTDSKHNWPLQRGIEKYYGIIHGSAATSNLSPANRARYA